MRTESDCIERKVKEFCVTIGSDPLLVQGAGGNVSWKDRDVLWIKASGMWLADSESKEIFVPVNLAKLQDALAEKNFSASPEVNSNSRLRPSIETLLHALMPHKVVAHLHAVEILAHLVQVDGKQRVKSLVGNSVKWSYVDYFKPGDDLARAVSEELACRQDVDVVFLGNHGVVIGGRGPDEVFNTLNKLTFKLKAKRLLRVFETGPATHIADFFSSGYVPCVDKEISALALEDHLINRLRHEWALYPDHVVFLGAKATILERSFTMLELDERLRSKPAFIFAIGDGVYENLAATPAQKSQLRCYFDVISRLEKDNNLSTLTELQVSELLDWDAEKYRQMSTGGN